MEIKIEQEITIPQLDTNIILEVGDTLQINEDIVNVLVKEIRGLGEKNLIPREAGEEFGKQLMSALAKGATGLNPSGSEIFRSSLVDFLSTAK